MKWGTTASALRLAVAFLIICVIGSLAHPVGAFAAWPAVQSFVKSSEVHSPTFIAPGRGWAIVGQRLLQTNDGGTRWSISAPAEWSTFLPRAISFGDPTHAWVVADNGVVLMTRDSGAYWERQASAALLGQNLADVRATDGSHVIAISSGGAVLGTDDGGATWSRRFELPGGQLCALFFLDAKHGWAVGADAAGLGVVLVTADGGTTWIQEVTPQTSTLSVITFSDASHGWAAGSAGLLRTSDGGATWVAIAAPSAFLGSEHARLAFVSATHGFLGRERAGESVPALWETTDAGASWMPCAIAEQSAGVHGLLALDASHVLATGLSQEAADPLSTACIWLWSAPGSPAPVAQAAPAQLQAAARLAAARAKAARARAAELKARHKRAAHRPRKR